MTRWNFNQDTSARDVSKVAKGIVYGIVALDVVLFIAYFNELLPAFAFGVLYWGSGLAMLAVIYETEAETHPEQRWWILLPVAIGAFGLLSWLRHLDRDH